MRDAERLPAHGTRARYNSRVARCQCDSCRAENTRYMRRWRDRHPAYGDEAGQQLELFR